MSQQIDVSSSSNSLIETKVGAGSATLLISGYLAWALFNFVPWLETNLPSELKNQLPILIAWLLATFAAYVAPHTHRPDLTPVITGVASVIQAVENVPLPPQGPLTEPPAQQPQPGAYQQVPPKA